MPKFKTEDLGRYIVGKAKLHHESNFELVICVNQGAERSFNNYATCHLNLELSLKYSQHRENIEGFHLAKVLRCNAGEVISYDLIISTDSDLANSFWKTGV